MKHKYAFSLAEVVVVFVLLGVISSLTIPTLLTNIAQKTYVTGYKKAFKTMSKACEDYLQISTNYFESTKESAALFAKWFIESSNVKELYADENPNSKSETYAALEFRGKIIAGAKNPVSISSPVKISSKPSFWVVTEDNIAYSIVIPEDAYCNEVLNINTSKTLDDALKSSCFAIIADTNGLQSKPNELDKTKSITNETYTSELKYDRYYIFVGANGAAAGNPKHILTGKILGAGANI